MITKLSEVVKMSPFLQSWRGFNNSTVETSNTKVQNYFTQQIDGPLTVVLMKQLRKYDSHVYDRLVEEGFEVEYQSMRFIFTKTSKGLQGSIFNKSGSMTGEVLIKNGEITETIPVQNRDAWRVLRALVEEI